MMSISQEILLSLLPWSNSERGYLIDRMKIKSKDFSFRKGESRDIPQLESCRINSIKNCKIYSKKQINIWINSKPNWEELIPKTIVSVTENHISGFVISGDKFLDYLYVEPNYQRHGLGNKLVSLVETTNMKCDCNPYSEKILIKRGCFKQKIIWIKNLNRRVKMIGNSFLKILRKNQVKDLTTSGINLKKSKTPLSKTINHCRIIY